MSFIEDMFVESGTMTPPAGDLDACLSSMDAAFFNSECWAATWEEIQEGGKLAEGLFGNIQLFGLMAGYSTC